MSTTVVIGAARQLLVSELRALVADVPDADVVHVAVSTDELSAVVGQRRPDLVLLDDMLGPQGVVATVRELAGRSLGTAVLVVNQSGATDPVVVMGEGARGVLSYPIELENFQDRFDSARLWAQRMSAQLGGGYVGGNDSGVGSRGRVTVFAGAKGGVGTTTIATHMAYDLAQKVTGIRVCLVDLDLLAGDVTAILEARQRVSIADVAKVSQDLDAGTILDAVVRHESGVSLLLAPQVVQESEFVTAGSVRAILRLLREQFHVILVDGGSHSSPAQAAAVEVADEVVSIVTPDVLAMRSFRRQISAWEGLGVRNEQDVHVLVNRAARDDMVHTEAIAKLTSGKVLGTRLPATFRRLEKAVNTRDPLEMREGSWWNAIEKIGAEVGVYAGYTPAVAVPQSEGGNRARRRRGRGESGQVALETVALTPIIAIICLLVWQIGLSALAFVWNGHAANAAVRAAAIGEDPEEAARDAVPDGMRDKVTVSVRSDGTVKVSTAVPILCPGCGSLPTQVTQVSEITEEPS